MEDGDGDGEGVSDGEEDGATVGGGATVPVKVKSTFCWVNIEIRRVLVSTSSEAVETLAKTLLVPSWTQKQFFTII